MAQRIEGKAIGITVDGVRLDCQADMTLTITVDTETDDPCKEWEEDGGLVTSTVSWGDPSASQINWEATGSSAMLIESVGAGANNDGYLDLFGKVINGSNPYVDIEILVPALNATTEGRLFTGSGILTNLALNAPVTGKGTQDFTITGKGKPTWEDVPFA
jgi:hypothetical protein